MNSAAIPTIPAAGGTEDDGLGIPDVLKVQNRVPLSPGLHTRARELAAAKVQPIPKVPHVSKRKDQLPLPPNKNANGASVTAPAHKKVEAKAPAKPKTSSKANASPAQKPQPAKAAAKRKAGERSRYDWNAAREKAAKGVVPAAPDFTANTHRYYRPVLAEVVKLAKAGDLKGLQAYRVKGASSSPRAVKNYREVAIAALKAKAA